MFRKMVFSRVDIQKWISQYKEHGIAGLSITHGTYTGDLRFML